MILKTPLISLKKNLRLPKFVTALYDEDFSVQIHQIQKSISWFLLACVGYSTTW